MSSGLAPKKARGPVVILELVFETLHKANIPLNGMGVANYLPDIDRSQVYKALYKLAQAGFIHSENKLYSTKPFHNFVEKRTSKQEERVMSAAFDLMKRKNSVKAKSALASELLQITDQIDKLQAKKRELIRLLSIED